MINILNVDGHKAVIQFDPDIGMLRGEFVGLNGGADFYAASVAELEDEGRKSLRVFFEACAEQDIEPLKNFSGKFNVRVNPEVHEAIVHAAAASQISLNQWVQTALGESINLAVTGQLVAKKAAVAKPKSGGKRRALKAKKKAAA